MGYFENVKADVATWIENNMDIEFDIMNGEYDSADDIAEYLNDTLWTEDSVTGNASGSYTFNRNEAKKYVLDDIDTVREALREFCVDAETIAEKFLDEEWEYLDVTARCYVLGSAIYEVMEEYEDTINEIIERRDSENEDEDENGYFSEDLEKAN